jgi:hypothetical protein
MRSSHHRALKLNYVDEDEGEVVGGGVDSKPLKSNRVDKNEGEVVIADIDGEPLESNCADKDEGEVDGAPLVHLHLFYKLSIGCKKITSVFMPSYELHRNKAGLHWLFCSKRCNRAWRYHLPLAFRSRGYYCSFL